MQVAFAAAQEHNSNMPLDNFHPAVAAWFRRAFAEPTPAQVRAWPAIQSGRHALIAAPTGSNPVIVCVPKLRATPKSRVGRPAVRSRERTPSDGASR